jgi:hypothetical protein
LGPVFGGGIVVCDNCNANRYSHIRIGTNWSDRTYANDTPFGNFLTGAYKFTVKQIEVFEIADYSEVPPIRSSFDLTFGSPPKGT